MDIGISCDQGTFKLRSCGVIVRDNKMLVDKSRRFDGYVFLGGHIALGENSADAILREGKEELGIDVSIKKLICINENIYPIPNSEKVAHEVACYYELKPSVYIPDEGLINTEIDNGVEITHHYKWVSLDEARENNVRPSWVAEIIKEGGENRYLLTDQTKKYE